jgi:hypothetical protein
LVDTDEEFIDPGRCVWTCGWATMSAAVISGRSMMDASGASTMRLRRARSHLTVRQLWNRPAGVARRVEVDAERA